MIEWYVKTKHLLKNIERKAQDALPLYQQNGKEDSASINGYMKAECWDKWRGSKYGNTGMKTIKWAQENIDAWLKDMNPEAAVIMFGTNDCPGMKLEDYEAAYRAVIQKCMDNGTVLIVTTMPPKHGADDKAKAYVDVVRKLAAEYKLPLCDYYKAIKDRRPDDWDGADPKFKPAEGEKTDGYNVNAPISRDGGHPSNPKAYQGDYTAEGLKNNGFVLRNYVTLMSYADVISAVLKTDAKAEAPKADAPKAEAPK